MGFLHAPGLTQKRNRKDRRFSDKFVSGFFYLQETTVLRASACKGGWIQPLCCPVVTGAVLCFSKLSCRCHTYTENLIPKTMPFQSCLKPYGTLGKRKKSHMHSCHGKKIFTSSLANTWSADVVAEIISLGRKEL